MGDGKLAINYGKGTGIPGQKLDAPVNLDLPTGDDGTHEQWKYFAKVLAGEAEPYPNAHSGRQSIQICQGAIISAKERTIVAVKDLG